MKKIIYFFIFLGMSVNFWAQIPNNNQDSKKNLSDLCFEEIFTETIKVGEEINIETLTEMDKIKFKKRVIVKRNKEYINSNNNVSFEVKIINHRDYFPKWYVPYTKMEIDETGTKSYYETYDSLFINGWVGSMVQKTQHGEYINNPRTGERYYQEGYSHKAQEAYDKKNQSIKTFGFLYQYAYIVPTAQMLQHFIDMGYEVITTDYYIIVRNSEKIIKWDLENHIITIQILEYGTLIETIKRTYKYYIEFGTYLIKKKENTKPMTFENGDCYDLVKTTDYIDFSNRCSESKDDEKLEPREEILKGKSFNISPNPVSGYLTIYIPDYNGKTTIEIIDMKGSIVMMRKTGNNDLKNKVDVSGLLSGMYIVKLSQGQNIFTKKFVKK